MSTTELFVTSIVCAFAVGVLITALSYEWSYRRINKRLVGYRVEGITLRTELEMRQQQHMGTPYRLETVAAHHATVPAVVSGGDVLFHVIEDVQWIDEPGWKIENGQPVYSSRWLNES